MRVKRKYGVHKYADGGKVELNKGAKKGGKKKKPKPDMLGTGMAAKTGDTLKNRRAEQMKDMGLKDGGKVKKMACGGKVRK